MEFIWEFTVKLVFILKFLHPKDGGTLNTIILTSKFYQSNDVFHRKHDSRKRDNSTAKEKGPNDHGPYYRAFDKKFDVKSVKAAVEPAFPTSVGIIVDRAKGFEIVIITILRLVVESNLVDGKWQGTTTGYVVIVVLVDLGDGVGGRVSGEAFGGGENHLFRDAERADRVGRGIQGYFSAGRAETIERNALVMGPLDGLDRITRCGCKGYGFPVIESVVGR